MWTRGELKERAKSVLSILYWKAFLVSLIILFVGDSERLKNTNLNFRNDNRGLINITPRMIADKYIIPYLGIVAIAVSLVILGAILIRILIGYHVEVGGRRFFLKAAVKKEGDIGIIGQSFVKGNYSNILRTMLYRSVLLILWTLLFIIPGIIKSYAYRMVPYILADNPNIGYKRAIELSNQMTNGQKLDIFILDLSFIGWYLLGSLLLGLGVFFVLPYENATNAELYLVLRKNVIEQGLCSLKELGIEENI